MANKLQTLLGQLGQITAQLREVLGMEPSQIVMDSAVLRFELAYEVMCKTLQAHATWQGKLVQSPREALKHGYRAGFITDWDMAEDMISDRNVLIHTYDLEAAHRVYAKLPGYLNFIQQVLTGLQNDDA
jgi:nucleotidyltransferase substrate binding protein (TIGR01987 family)